jgi:endonuclease/exonuclease/phosphatase family metal-dependent hydrolase
MVLLAGGCLALRAAERFRIATFNLENYGDETSETRVRKSEASRAAVRETIRALRADVLALQELGGPAPFRELQQSLKAADLDYPQGQLLTGADTNLHVAVLSRFPIVACHPHTNDAYLLMGRRHFLQRGLLEVRIQVNSNYTFTALIAHLKSRRANFLNDEAEMRLAEAQILRAKVDAILRERPTENLVVLGDLNDVKDSRPIRAVIGRYANALWDTRPAEQPCGSPGFTPGPTERPAIAWTHYYAREDSYSRIDYILLSAGMKREWVPEATCVLTLPIWSLASDHRPMVATFVGEDR